MIENENYPKDMECTRCYLRARFHHVSTKHRKDKKITVWYKCSNGHRNSIDVS